MTWIYPATIAGLALASADICVKLASGRLSSSLGLLVYGSCTFLSGLGWVLWQRLHGIPLYAKSEGLLAGVGVGVSFAAVVAGLYITFEAGAPISIVSPFVRLGGLLLASAAGVLLFREPLTGRYALGLVLSGIGLYLIATR